MTIPNKIEAANKINDLLNAVVSKGGLRLKYRITVDPPLPEERDWERPEILVQFSGPDSPLLLERGGELLRALELLALEMLRLPGNEHEKISFDCMNHRSLRLEELRMAAAVAAERVRKTGAPYELPPCRRASGALCISLCATLRTCAPRAKVRDCAASWWCIRKITEPRANQRAETIP